MIVCATGKRSAGEKSVAGAGALLPPILGSYIGPGVSRDIPWMAVSELDAAPALKEQLLKFRRGGGGGGGGG